MMPLRALFSPRTACQFDGMCCGNRAGILVEVHEPRWWQLGRWLEWWREHGKGQITVEMADGTHVVLRVKVARVHIRP